MSPSSAGRQRRSLPRSGSPLWGAFLFGNGPECSDASDGTWEDAPGKIPPDGLPGRTAAKGRCRCAGHDGSRSTPVAREKTGVRRGRGRIAVPRLMTALRQGPAVIAAGLRRGALSATGVEQGRRAPLLRPCHTSATGRLRREDGSAGGERSALLPSGLAICGLLVYGSSFIEAHSGSGPGCPAMRYGAFFVVFRSWGRGRRQAGLQGLGRCGRSQPFWRIEKWLTSA